MHSKSPKKGLVDLLSKMTLRKALNCGCLDDKRTFIVKIGILLLFNANKSILVRIGQVGRQADVEEGREHEEGFNAASKC